MSDIKTAKTATPVLDLIRNRWSARSFSQQAISDDELDTIIEAGSWAFSAMNEQPWRFIVAHRGTSLFQRLFDVLSPGNQPWCRNAAVLLLALGKTRYESNGKVNETMLHDIGAATMLMTLQGNSMGIYSHVMGGYDQQKAVREFNLADDTRPVVMMAFGFPDAPEKLEEPYKTRELTPRTRKPIRELIVERG